MKSNLGQLIERMTEIAKGSPATDINQIAQQITEEENKLHLSVNPTMFAEHGRAIASIAGSNLLACMDDGDGILKMIMLGKLRDIMDDEVTMVLLSYVCKHATYLQVAEQKAQESSELVWMLPPDQQPPVSPPTQDPPVEQHDEPPSAS